MRIIEREQRTAEQMIRIYCRYKEGNKELCPTCRQLLQYAHNRLKHCTFGDQKKTCRTASLFSGLPPLLGRETDEFGGERNRRVRKIAGRFSFAKRSPPGLYTNT